MSYETTKKATKSPFLKQALKQAIRWFLMAVLLLGVFNKPLKGC